MNWPRSKLGTITEAIDYGLTTSAVSRQVGPKFLRITDIQDDAVNWQSVPHCLVEDGQVARFCLAAGDIVFARTGATTGKSFLIRECPNEAVFASYLIRVRPSAKLDPLFLSHYFRTPEYWRQIGASANGSTQPGINATKLGELEVPVPFPDDPRRSLAEQKRIAAILDKADAIRRRRQEAARLADALIPSVFYEMFGDPTFNRYKWPEMTMLEVTEKVTDGEHITPLRTSNGIRLLSARNVKNGYIDLDEEVDFVGQEVFERIRQRCDPRQGDVLISCSGTVGRVTTVRITEPFTLVRSVAMVRPNTRIVNADYLEYYLRTEHAQRHINRSANKSSQANIFLGPIKKLPILVPPIERQREFLAKAEECRTLAASMADATRLADDGFNSFVQRAFRGEL